MRIKTKRIDYGSIVRESVKRDFQRRDRVIVSAPKPAPLPVVEPEYNDQKRIMYISDASAYAKYARYIVNKLVRIKQKSKTGSNSYYCEFVYDDDRIALNTAAGWSNNKREYLFDGVKFKN